MAQFSAELCRTEPNWAELSAELSLSQLSLSQHVLEPTRQNNILDLLITTEEALLVTLQIMDKIWDHQAIQFLLQTEKEETAVEKPNYYFRMANFEAMRADHDERLERLIVNSDATQGFELLRRKSLNLVGDIS